MRRAFRVRLKRTLNRSVEAADGSTVKYYKWMLADVPRDLVEELGWDESTEIHGRVRDGKLVIEREK